MTEFNRASLAEIVDERARINPQGVAFRTAEAQLDWMGYRDRSGRLAGVLHGLAKPGERVGVLLPDGIAVHIAFLATEKAGLVAVGIGARAGFAEVEHLLGRSGATILLSAREHGELDAREVHSALREAGLPLRHHVVIDDERDGAFSIYVDGTPARGSVANDREDWLGADELFLLNSTSGTTGLPKCVRHNQRRWFAFHEFALRAGRLEAADVFMSVVPAPFGFGLWTAHFTPTQLGACTILQARFDAEAALALIERYRVTVLAAVSTQFIMMLESEGIGTRDLGSLRVLFTGGERVPRARAAEFEARTGARVLQFYGSNEIGAVSGTTLDDEEEQRLATAGRVIPEMTVRLFDAARRDVTDAGRGQPGCRGPTLSLGYHGDEAATRELYTDDGFMLLGDIVTIDADGYLRVVGRIDDFIIRGGKNISTAAVEEAVATHPAVAHAAVVAMPDATFGERACAFVELREGDALDLDDVKQFLIDRGSSKENLPERLIVMEELPRSSGGKVAKEVLRERIREGAEERQSGRRDRGR